MYKLDTAEAVYIGTAAVSCKKGAAIYTKWRDNLNDVLHILTRGEKRKTLVDLYKEKQKERVEKNKKWFEKLKQTLKNGG